FDPVRSDIAPRHLPPVVAAGSAAVSGLGAAGTSPAAAEPSARRDEIANPRFENGLDGWKVVGDGASVVELDDGTCSLRCAPTQGGSVTVSQEVEIRRPRWWTLRTSVRAGGAGTASTLTRRARRTQEQVHIPVADPAEGLAGRWLRSREHPPAAVTPHAGAVAHPGDRVVRGPTGDRPQRPAPRRAPRDRAARRGRRRRLGRDHGPAPGVRPCA